MENETDTRELAFLEIASDYGIAPAALAKFVCSAYEHCSDCPVGTGADACFVNRILEREGDAS